MHSPHSDLVFLHVDVSIIFTVILLVLYEMKKLFLPLSHVSTAGECSPCNTTISPACLCPHHVFAEGSTKHKAQLSGNIPSHPEVKISFPSWPQCRDVMEVSPRICAGSSVVRLVRATVGQLDREDPRKPWNHPSPGPGCSYNPHSQQKAAAETRTSWMWRAAPGRTSGFAGLTDTRA